MCLGVAWGWGGTGHGSGRKERWPSASSSKPGPCPAETTRWGGGGGTCGPSCSSGQVLFCPFLWNAKGVFVLFCFFVKLKKNLHLILELPYLKKKKEKKKQKNKKKLGRSLHWPRVLSCRPHFPSTCGLGWEGLAEEAWGPRAARSPPLHADPSPTRPEELRPLALPSGAMRFHTHASTQPSMRRQAEVTVLPPG